MFTILGGDGKEYGPVTAEQIRAWIAGGRANLDTKAKIVGGTEDWKRLGELPEFTAPSELPPPIAAISGTVPHLNALMGVPALENLASLGTRLGAAFVDGFLVWLCRLPALFAMAQLVRAALSTGEQPSVTILAAIMSQSMSKAYPFLVALALLQGIFIGLRAQSIGKMFFGIQIVRQLDGSKASFPRAFFLRGGVPFLIEQVPILGTIFWIVDSCFIFAQDRRCLHDHMSGTYVSKLKR